MLIEVCKCFFFEQNAVGAIQDKANEVAGAAGTRLTRPVMSLGRSGRARSRPWRTRRTKLAISLARSGSKTKQALSEAAQAASDKASQAKDGAGGLCSKPVMLWATPARASTSSHSRTMIIYACVLCSGCSEEFRVHSRV